MAKLGHATALACSLTGLRGTGLVSLVAPWAFASSASAAALASSASSTCTSALVLGPRSTRLRHESTSTATEGKAIAGDAPLLRSPRVCLLRHGCARHRADGPQGVKQRGGGGEAAGGSPEAREGGRRGGAGREAR